MEIQETLQEYCCRLGLKQSLGNTTLALEFAERKYRELSGREVTPFELNKLMNLIEEIIHAREQLRYSL